MNIPELYVAVRTIVETAKGVTDLIRGIIDLTENDSELLGSAEENESSVVLRALHSLKVGEGSAPRIAIVGETSVGKTALVNALFGSQLAAVKLTTDTTRAVLRIQFPSNLVIYDTPGIFGDEKLENITRSFIGLRQRYNPASRVRSVPFQTDPNSDEIIQLSGKDIRKEVPIDIVLWTVDVSRPLNNIMRDALDLFFTQLDKKFGKHLVVAGTHLDVLQEVSDEEAKEQLRVWNEISNNQIIPLSSTEGEGLTDLAKELFQRLPGNTSLSKLQQSLNQAAKINRCSFVVAEMSHPLAMIMLMSGDNQEEIEIHVTILITLLCSHYSVDEETWKDLHGDSIAIAHQVQQTSGVESIVVERDPIGVWETIRSWFGSTFYGTGERYRMLGVQGLLELLPIFYELIYEFEDFDHPPLTHESISRVVQSQQTDLEPLVRLEDSEKLALRINDLLKSLLKF